MQRIVREGQVVWLPLSGLVFGLMNALFYGRAFGWTLALAAGAFFGLVLGATCAWMAYRSGGGARHAVVGAAVYALTLASLMGGVNFVLAQMADMAGWMTAAWLIGVATAILPVLVTASRTRARLCAEGDSGAWASANLDLHAGLLAPDALAVSGSERPAMTPWAVGALSVNVALVWRLQGGGDTTLLALCALIFVVASVWAGVGQVGPRLGKAWFVIDVEDRIGRRLGDPQGSALQAMRRNHWLARWFMRSGG